MDKLIGRKNEIEELRRYERSGKSEFIAVYGRRRVGKTFMIQSLFRNDFSFSMSGNIDGTFKEQLEYFNLALLDYGYTGKSPKNWLQAFESLKQLLKGKSGDGRLIVFIDEIPCLDTPKSGFIKALDHFWNSWGCNQDRLMLIVCGSATSWMVKNIIDNKGGLHNRVTHEMYVAPFNLHEVEEYLYAHDIDWDRLTITQTYMILGGIPYYLSLLNPTLSMAQNVDRLFFNENGELRREYARLYRSLFRNPEPYMKIIECLFEHKKGLTRSEIRELESKISSSKLSLLLDDLKYCGFIRYYNVIGARNKVNTNNGLYQLTDLFSIFYLTFCKQPSTNPHFWVDNMLSHRFSVWYGLSFERVCMAHIPQIKRALGIDRIHNEYYSWYNRNDERKVQIDLIIDRADRVINICEIKYSDGFYTLDKEEYEKLLIRIDTFKNAIDKKRQIVPTLITTNGLAKGKYTSFFRDVVTVDSLFEDE